MSPSPDTRDSRTYPSPQRRLPATPKQRRLGTRIGLSVILLALLVILLLDHYGVIH